MNNDFQRVFVFHGCDRKVGTTMISRCAAKGIAGSNNLRRVLFVCLNGTDDIHYFTSSASSIEEIKSRVDNNLISGEEIMNYCDRDDNLYILGGVSGITAHRDYGVDFSGKLLNEALKVFDIIVADCGNELDCSLCVGGLTAGACNILVANQNETSLLRYESVKGLYEALNISFDLCVVNRFLDSDPHDLGFVKARLGESLFPVFKTVKEEKNYGRIAEMDNRPLSFYKTPGFTGDIKALVRTLTVLTEEVPLPEYSKKTVKTRRS